MDSGWDLHFCRNLRDSEINDLVNLVAVLHSFRLLHPLSDSILWTPSPSGTFSISSFFFVISSFPPSPPFPYRTLWFSLSPSKSSSFPLESGLNCVPTLDIIQRFYPHIALSPKFCPLCFSAAETNARLIIHCPFSWKLWGKLFDLANLKIVIPATLTDFFTTGVPSLTEEAIANFGIFAFMVLFGLFGKNGIDMHSRISLDISLLFGNLFCISLLVGLKKIVPCLAFLLNLCIVICSRFSFLRSTIALFN